VRQVAPGGAAATLGLERGDIIDALRPAGERSKVVRTTEELAFLLNRLDRGTEVRLDVWRDEDGDGRLELDDDYSELFKGKISLR
jgi:S1-C subfamily serine protease